MSSDCVGPRPQTARRFAPGIETPLRAFGAQRRVPIRLLLIVKGGNPLSHFPPKSPAANRRFAAICFLLTQQYTARSPAPTQRSRSAGQSSRWRPSDRRRPPEVGETHTLHRSHDTLQTGTPPSPHASQVSHFNQAEQRRSPNPREARPTGERRPAVGIARRRRAKLTLSTALTTPSERGRHHRLTPPRCPTSTRQSSDLVQTRVKRARQGSADLRSASPARGGRNSHSPPLSRHPPNGDVTIASRLPGVPLQPGRAAT